MQHLPRLTITALPASPPTLGSQCNALYSSVRQQRWCSLAASPASDTLTPTRPLRTSPLLHGTQRRNESTTSADSTIDQKKEKQARTPWHRQGSATPPVKRLREASAMTKGKLLTTPSRLLKLILPLSTLDRNSDRKDIEPLALLVHPQQPLSYLERLIQSELSPIKQASGDEKIPYVHFRAEDAQEESIAPKAPGEKKDTTPEDLYEGADLAEDEGLEEVSFAGKKARTGKLSHHDGSADGSAASSSSQSTGMPPPGPVAGSVPKAVEGPDGNSDAHNPELKFIRWSPSTEIGDFIRDAARSHEFSVEIEGQESQILVGVPSFNDRTHYLRSRLRTTARKISDMAAIKQECDFAAHKTAQRVAVAGGGLLMAYWYIVYRLTFETDLGWDVMEPVTYLVGLSCLIGGYLWFLYHNREVSYRAAMSLTISRRRAKLYEAKGFNVGKWEGLIDEANSYRNEVKQIAREYDVEWDEHEDEKDEGVTRAMRRMRRVKEGREKGGSDEGEREDG